MADIVELGELRIERKGNKYCPHLRLTYSERDQYIECQDCKMPVQPFQAFMILVKNYNSALADLISRRKELEQLELRSQKGLLLATRKADHAWRSKTMLPTCPHCGRGIAPEDGFGDSGINRKIEFERRKFEQNR